MLELTGRRNRVDELTYSPCGRWLAAGGPGGVHVWDLAAPADRPRRALPPVHGLSDWQRRATRLAFLADGRLIFLSGPRCYSFDLATGRIGAFNRVGVAAGGAEDPADGRGGDAIPVEVADLRGADMAVSPDGRWLATTAGAVVRVRPLGRDGSCGPAAWLSLATTSGKLAFSADSARLAVADDGLRVFAVDTGEVVERRPPPPGRQSRPTRDVRFAPDGRRVAVRRLDGVDVWDLAAPTGGRPRPVADPGGGRIEGLAFHPSGGRLATTAGWVVRLWDADTWRPVTAYQWNVGKLYAVAFAPDGTTAAVGGHTGRVLVFDLD